MRDQLFRLTQNFNPDGILGAMIAKYLHPQLVLPHFYVERISKIDPDPLKEIGFKGSYLIRTIHSQHLLGKRYII